MALFARLDPNDVFTPRSTEVNSEMYVERADLELSLRKALAGTKNIIISGESGNGKTWLYKRVFAENSVHYELVNLANASLQGGLQNAFKDKVDRLGRETKVSREKSGGVKVQPAGVGVNTDGKASFTVGQQSEFEKLLALVRERAGKKIGILVYDNFEQVAGNTEVVKAISDTIILLDDDDLAKYGVKLCIVGVPNDIQQYLSKAAANITTLANRLVEIPEVARMSKDEASVLAAKGFKKLGYRIRESFTKQLYDGMCWKTDRIAQHIHEYCLAVSLEAERNYLVIDESTVAKAERDWLKQTLIADYATIEQRMNARDTKAGRRNQILYSLGKCDAEDFKYLDIEEIVRNEFPKSTNDVSLNIAGNLTELSGGEKPLIRRTPKGDAYRFASPKYRMCLRTMLVKNGDERVDKIPLGGL